MSVVEALTNTNYDYQERGLGALAVSLKEAVKGIKSDKKAPATEGDDSDEDQDDVFSTNETIDLMSQLRDVLTMSVDQGWKIFDETFVYRYVHIFFTL